MLEIDDTASSERSGNRSSLSIKLHVCLWRPSRSGTEVGLLHDHPSWCDQVSHSNKLLQVQLTEAHISDMAAAPSDPAGSWLMPGIASESVVSPQPQPLQTDRY